MGTIITKRKKIRAKRALSILTSITTIVWLSGLLALAPFGGVGVSRAAVPADFGLTEGDAISAWDAAGDPDIYIVNDQGFKRLFLNPVIFEFYGHIGWDKVKQVSAATRDAFVTSGLFRQDGNERVYGVETTGEDEGTLHWVNTSGAQAVADDPDFFKKVFVINDNEFNWYTNNGTVFGSEYSSVSEVPDYSRGDDVTPPPGNELSATLAPGNPAANTLTTKAQGVEYLRVRFTGSGTINSLTVKRSGAGATADFDNVYVYDGAERLTSGKSLSSSTGEATFSGLDIEVSGTKDISIVGDMASGGATAGNVNNLSIVAGSATAGLSGLPLQGNNFTVSGAAGGTVTLAKTGSLSNPNVGQKNVQLSDFKLTTATEGTTVKRITMIQGGTVKPGDITNLKLTTGTSEWSGTINSDGYVIFDLGNGHFIEKGGNDVFKVWGDVAGKKDETIKLYFEQSTDVHAVGDQFGFGVSADVTAIDTSSEAHSLTLQGGILTIAFNGPNASTIGTTTDDTVLMRLSYTAASDIEIRKTRFNLCKDDTGNGTYNDAFNSSGWADLDDFKVVDEDSGVVVIGPLDGSGFTTDDATACPGSVGGAQKQFTDSFDLLAGQTRNFKVTADFKADDSGTGVTLGSTDRVRVELNNYAEDTPDLTIMKYSGTNTTVADADIVPNADIQSNEFTLSAASLTLGLAGTPTDETVVKGTKDVDVVGITFKASNASDLRVTDITLTGYVEDEAGDTHNEGVDTNDSGVTVGNAFSNFRLYEAESDTLVAGNDKVVSNQLSVANTGTLQFSFSGTPWTIKAGETKTLLVRADASTNAASGSNGDRYAFDINTTTEVTALDDSDNTVNPTAGSVDPNGATSPTVNITVKNGGTIAVSASPNTPTKRAFYWGQNGVEAAQFRFTATDEAFYIETLTLQHRDGTDTAADWTSNVKSVQLNYKNEAGSTLTKTANVGNTGSASFGFSGTERPYVPKDNSTDISVLLNLKTKDENATSTSAGDATAPTFAVQLNLGDASMFDAFGAGSGVKATGTDNGDGSTNLTDVAGNAMYVYRVFPEFEKITSTAFEANSSTLTPTEMEVLRFKINAMGAPGSKLLFDNAATGSGSIKFEVISSGSAGADPTFKVYESDGTQVDVNGTITNAGDPSPKSTMTVDFSSKDVEIGGGQSKEFYIRVDLTNFSDNGDYFQVVLRDDEAGLINWVDNSTGSTSDPDVASVTGVLDNLELIGTTKTRSI